MMRAWLATSSWFAFALGLASQVSASQGTAGYDTLSVESVLQRREAKLDSLLLPDSAQLDTTGVATTADSLDRIGSAAIRSHRASDRTPRGRRFHFGMRPLALTTYNRVEGSRLGFGFAPRLHALVHADAAGAYGFASHRWSGRAGLALGGGRVPVLRFGWSDLVVPFGPNQGEHSMALLALVAGQDRQDYLRRRSYEVSLAPHALHDLAITMRAFEQRDWPVKSATDFSFVQGDLPIDEPNPAVDAGTVRGLAFQTRFGAPTGRATASIDLGVTNGDFDYAWQSARAVIRHVGPDGGSVSLGLEFTNVGGSPPVQAAAYLGGDGNLRGYERLEFGGKQRLAARLEYALGIDFLARSHIPLLEKLHLQFIPFADAGTTWRSTRVVDRTRANLDGELRASFGLGLQRALWLPGLESVRLDIAHRTDGRPDALTFWLRVVPLDL